MPSEFELIARYFARPSRRRDVLLGVGDDAAVLQVPADCRLVAAVDSIVEGVHFPVGTDPRAIGHRALAVNLSDLAAMGAEPAWITLSLSLPRNETHWLEQFSAGLYALADRYNVALVGGDTVRGPLSATIQVLGLVEANRWLVRSGAQVGDTIFVSGCPGEAAAGLAIMQQGRANESGAQSLADRFLWPEPQVRLGRALRSLANAAIDISDGLLADLGHICEMSGCAAHVDLDKLPISQAMQAAFTSEECESFGVSGGDDYELLFTVPPDRLSKMDVVRATGVACTAIGQIVAGEGVRCFRAGEAIAMTRHGYDHFAT